MSSFQKSVETQRTDRVGLAYGQTLLQFSVHC